MTPRRAPVWVRLIWLLLLISLTLWLIMTALPDSVRGGIGIGLAVGLGAIIGRWLRRRRQWPT